MHWKYTLLHAALVLISNSCFNRWNFNTCPRSREKKGEWWWWHSKQGQFGHASIQQYKMWHKNCQYFFTSKLYLLSGRLNKTFRKTKFQYWRKMCLKYLSKLSLKKLTHFSRTINILLSIHDEKTAKTNKQQLRNPYFGASPFFVSYLSLV